MRRLLSPSNVVGERASGVAGRFSGKGACGAQERPFRANRVHEWNMLGSNQVHTGYIRRAYACTNDCFAQLERPWRCERNSYREAELRGESAGKMKIRDLGATFAPTLPLEAQVANRKRITADRPKGRAKFAPLPLFTLCLFISC